MNVCLMALASQNVLSVDGSFLFIFVSIFVLIFLLNRTLFKPINKVLDERNRLGAGRIKEARELLKLHEAKLNRYEAQLQQARSEAYHYLEAERKKLTETRNSEIEKVKSEISKQITSAKEDIAGQATNAKRNLETEAKSMATVISSQILNRAIVAGGN